MLRGRQERGTEEVGVLRGQTSSGRACRASDVPLGLGPKVLALATSDPGSFAAGTRLPRASSIQEEQGAPGRPGRNYDSQDALRRRAFTTGQ